MDPREAEGPGDAQQPQEPGAPDAPSMPGAPDDIRERIEALRLVLLSQRGRGNGPGSWPGSWPGSGRSFPGGDHSGRSHPGHACPGRGTGEEGDSAGHAGEIEHARDFSGRHGKCLLIERDVGDILGAGAPGDERLLEAYRRLLPPGEPGRAAPPDGKQAVVFLDLETTGLAATPLFLAGALVHGEGRLKAVQFLARDYSEERCVIDLVDGMLAGSRLCVTFNGKSFDLPYLRERAKYHRLALGPGPEQFDLLHHARRRWKHRLPDCRLLTLEWFILGRRRMGDVDGWEVPCIYHEFVHTQDARRLKQVLRHNLMDVLAMAELMVSLAEA